MECLDPVLEGMKDLKMREYSIIIELLQPRRVTGAMTRSSGYLKKVDLCRSLVQVLITIKKHS